MGIKKVIVKFFLRFGYSITKVYKYDVLMTSLLKLTKNISEENLNVIDVGANYGNWSKLVKHWIPNCSIFCIEPDPNNFRILKKNLSQMENIRFLNYAISDKSGKSNFYLTQNGESNSLLEPLENSIFPSQKLKQKTTVDTVTLEQFMRDEKIETIHILKLDIQGYEYNILKNIENILNDIYIIFLEINFVDQYKNSLNWFKIHEYLENNNFNFYNIGKIWRKNEMAIFSDAIYINKSYFKNSIFEIPKGEIGVGQ